MKTLKTNLFGTLAVLLAFGLTLGLSAFTTAPIKRDAYTFYYDGPLPATIGDVQQENNWKHDSEGQECDGEDETACTITIDEDFVDLTNPSEPVLEQDADLRASASGSSAYVTGSDDSNMNIFNKTY